MDLPDKWSGTGFLDFRMGLEKYMDILIRRI